MINLKELSKQLEARLVEDVMGHELVNLSVISKEVDEDLHHNLHQLSEQESVQDVSDGYHTFKELYIHRNMLFSIVCQKCGGWKSRKHFDGTMFEGFFIAGVESPQGQITYHVENSLWNKFTITELKNAPQWDGHDSNEALARITSLKIT